MSLDVAHCHPLIVRALRVFYWEAGQGVSIFVLLPRPETDLKIKGG